MLAASWPLPGSCWARADACAQILNPILYRADFLPHPNWLAGPAADARFKLSLLAQEGGGAGESKQKDHTFTRKSEYLGWREFVPLAQVGAPTHWPIVLSSMHGRSRLRQREHEGCGWVGVPLRGGAGRQRRAAQGFAGFFAGRQCRGLQAGSAGVCRQAAQGFAGRQRRGLSGLAPLAPLAPLACTREATVHGGCPRSAAAPSSPSCSCATPAGASWQATACWCVLTSPSLPPTASQATAAVAGLLRLGAALCGGASVPYAVLPAPVVLHCGCGRPP